MLSAGEIIDIFSRLTRTLAVEQSLDTCLDAVTRAAMELAPCDHSSVRILDATRTELLSGARSGDGILPQPMPFRPGWGIAGWVVEHARPALVPDTSLDERFVDLGDQGFRIGSMIAVPLFSLHQVIGVLAMTAQRRGVFGDEHLTLAKLLANTAIPRIESARMRRLAITDHTSLALRENVMEPKLVDELRQAHPALMPLSLLEVDLDGFARVDEKHGHEVADTYLRLVAERLRTLSRAEDILFRGRGGGFVLIMPGAGTALAQEVAERIRTGIADSPIALNQERKRFQTVSIGLATWDGKMDARTLIARVEATAKTAGQAGGNQVCTWSARRGAPGRSEQRPGVRGSVAAGLDDDLDEVTTEMDPQGR